MCWLCCVVLLGTVSFTLPLAAFAHLILCSPIGLGRLELPRGVYVPSRPTASIPVRTQWNTTDHFSLAVTIRSASVDLIVRSRAASPGNVADRRGLWVGVFFPSHQSRQWPTSQSSLLTTVSDRSLNTFRLSHANHHIL
jgi:hypothetical protein